MSLAPHFTPPANAHPSDPGCIICKIVAGKIPSYKIFEDDAVLAFLDIGPIVKGHALVVPKAHYPTLMETPPEVLAEIARRMPTIVKAVLAGTGAGACHVLVNNGPEAMQSIGHLHYHILPRSSGDTFHLPWPTTPLDQTAATAQVVAIRSQLKP